MLRASVGPVVRLTGSKASLASCSLCSHFSSSRQDQMTQKQKASSAHDYLRSPRRLGSVPSPATDTAAINCLLLAPPDLLNGENTTQQCKLVQGTGDHRQHLVPALPWLIQCQLLELCTALPMHLSPLKCPVHFPVALPASHQSFPGADGGGGVSLHLRWKNLFPLLPTLFAPKCPQNREPAGLTHLILFK